MSRASIIDKLDKVTFKAAIFMRKNRYPVLISEETTALGRTLVKRNSLGLYDIIDAKQNKVFENIIVFGIAVIIAQKHDAGDVESVKKIILLEEKYTKHHTDMTHYLCCMRIAKAKKDFVRMAILEDKFRISEQKAKLIRDKISVFKKINNHAIMINNRNNT